ncbi:MAG TPA: fosfomycin resistance glutathione transferase [Polyangiaceae bacterium]|nr:fosfomycin resistance glutathione transferase [Polyangiaceae bacterium]
MSGVGSLNHVTLSVAELERSFRFYSQVLQFRPLARWKRGAYLLAGEQTWLCLTLDARVRSEPAAEYSHLAFSVTAESFATVVARLRDSGARAWQENSSEGDSFYFLDPDGHKLELHVGDWRSRLEACKQQPYDEMEFF